MMTQRARRLGWIAGAGVVAISSAILVLGRATDELQPPLVVSRGVASAVLLATPGLIGIIGAAAGRRTVLAAAGVLCLLQSGISFSLVTLAYLLPAMVLLRTAVDGSPSAAARVGPVRGLIVVALSVPIAVAIALGAGILGVIAIALVAGIAATARLRPGLQSTRSAAARGSAVVLLVVGAWVASFALAETACWVGRGTPGGDLTWERIPPTSTLTIGPEDVVKTCASGTPTMGGIAVAGGLLLAALTAAWMPRRIPPDPR